MNDRAKFGVLLLAIVALLATAPLPASAQTTATEPANTDLQTEEEDDGPDLGWLGLLGLAGLLGLKRRDRDRTVDTTRRV